jgi:hypothetical protein
VTEEVRPIPKNIYGVTKAAAEDLCQLFHRNQGLACVVLRTSRFFPEEDDNEVTRETYADDNARANEFLFRRVDLEDAVSAHLLASQRAAAIGFGRYIVSATTPFLPEDLPALRSNAPAVVGRRVPSYQAEYERRGWTRRSLVGRFWTALERERTMRQCMPCFAMCRPIIYAASIRGRRRPICASAQRAVAYPVAWTGAEASCPVAGVGEPAAFDRETATADAFGEPEFETLEFVDPLIYPRHPAARQSRPVAPGRRAVRRQLASSAPISTRVSPIRCAKTMNAIRRSTARG